MHHRQCISKDHRLHPQHDVWTSALECGAQVHYEKGTLAATRTLNSQLGCMRCLNVEPTKSLWSRSQQTQRDVYYEIRLYRALPWFQGHGQYQCILLLKAGTPERSKPLSSAVLLRGKGDKPRPLDFEAKCKRLEEVMSSTLCSCCAGRRTSPCDYCNDVLPRPGFHRCEFEEYPVRKPGTLYSQGEECSEDTHY